MDILPWIDAARLKELEDLIQKGLETFIEVGNALLEIRDRRLYRETHNRFEDYCRERWQMSHRHANRLIESAEVIQNLGPFGPTPTHESQLRPLNKLEPEQQREAWHIATSLTPNPTAEQVTQVVTTIERAISQAAIDAAQIPIEHEQKPFQGAPQIDQRWIEFVGAISRLNRIDWDAAAIAEQQFAITTEESVFEGKLSDCQTALERINDFVFELEKRSHVLR